MDKNHARAAQSSILGLKSTLTTDPALTANFNINELEPALKSVKLGTAANLDGHIWSSLVIVVKERKNG
jgi:hypothetical protein